MAVTHVLNVDGGIEFLDKLGLLLHDPDLTQAFGKIADVVEDQLQQGFENESAPDGTPWTPWMFRDPADSPYKKTLQSSGRLRESTRRGGAGNLEVIDRHGLRYGSLVPYAAVHQEGQTVTTDRPLWGRFGMYLPAGSTLNIAQREFLGFSDDTIEQAGEIILDELFEQIERL